MRIDTESWQALHNKLGTTETSPPTPVYLAVYTLTRGASIVASYARQELQESTTRWRNWVITETSHLVYTELEFAAEQYDSYAEDNLRQVSPNGGIEPDVRQGWVRRLDTVTSLQIDAVGRLTGFRSNWYPVGDIRLTFADGTHTIVPGQMEVSQQERDWSDLFTNTLRERARL